MNRDNLLYLVIGVLAGFIAGYLLEERMAEVQPPLRVHGATEATGEPSAAGGGPMTGGGGAAAPQPGAGSGPAVAAVRQLQERVAQNPDDADAVLGLANANFDISNWTRAIELYEHYLELRPDDADVLSDLGICYRAQGDFDDAVASFDKALAKDPDHWLARFNKAIVLGIDEGNLDAADQVVAEMRALRPDAPDLQRLEAELDRRRSAG
ncbi:MAG: tetratricopeptide repeat protein [Acidobacteria bacterium]|nr:tetratricopeptide repeat protein [Acidobacteriota bacterium]